MLPSALWRAGVVALARQDEPPGIAYVPLGIRVKRDIVSYQPVSVIA